MAGGSDGRRRGSRSARGPEAAPAVAVTNPEKLLWPADGIRKRDLVRYYEAVAPALLPHLRDRPLVLKPYPNGIDGRFYFRQTLPRSAPAWLPRWEHVPSEGAAANQMPLANSPEALTWLANQAAIELHPWLSRIDAPDEPDVIVFDLDVSDGARFPLALEAALLVRAAVEAEGRAAYPKTTGGDGIHLYIPIARGPAFAETRAWAHGLAERLAAAHPGLFTIESKIAGREDRVLIDYAQNAQGKTTVAVYSVRPRPGAPVSMPVTWEEIEAGEIRPGDFTLRTVPARLAERGDLFAPTLPGDRDEPQRRKGRKD